MHWGMLSTGKRDMIALKGEGQLRSADKHRLRCNK